jgi:hypothetical protein
MARLEGDNIYALSQPPGQFTERGRPRLFRVEGGLTVDHSFMGDAALWNKAESQKLSYRGSPMPHLYFVVLAAVVGVNVAVAVVIALTVSRDLNRAWEP